MYIASKVVGLVQTNCYLLGEEKGKQAALIDPGDQGEALIRWAEEQGYQVTMILLTHGHFDHMSGLKAALAALEAKGIHAPVYVHRADYPLAPCGFYDNVTLEGVPDVRFYDEGDTVTLGDLTIQVIHTPGHTPGGVCLVVDNVIFSGDTLFRGSCGRTDFPGSSPDEILASLGKLAKLPGNYAVYPGHEGQTTLQAERQSNPYVLYALRTC